MISFNFKPHFFTLIILILNLLSLSFSQESQQQPIVTLPNGNKLIGIFQNSLYTNKKFAEFRGIPYAQAARFQAPKPFEELWTEPRDATTYGSVCPQIDIFNDDRPEAHVEDVLITGDEDCLFLNVAVPYFAIPEDLSKPPSNVSRLPVIVWLHGGSFQYESGDIYGPHAFLKENIILVTLNYRLSVLGFLNYQDNGIAGNFGLKDQSLALRWVKDNIAAFGGDPDSITLAGVNSGAVSAHLHMLSPMSEGLFHKVYLQSGTALAPWAIVRNATGTAKKFLKWISECNNYTSTSECLRKVDWRAIVRRQQRLTEWYIDPLVPFGPTIEPPMSPAELDSSKAPFLTRDPYEIISSGDFWAKNKVIITLGINSHEGLLHSVDIAHHTTLFTTLNMEWARAIPISLLLRDTIFPKSSLVDLSFKIKDFYFGEIQILDPSSEDNSHDQEEQIQEIVSPDGTQKKQIRNTKAPKWKFIAEHFFQFEELTNMYSDRYFNIPTHHTALLHATHQPKVYLYWFDFLGSQSTTQLTGYNDTIFGVSHFDQIQYLFKTPYFKELEDPNEIAFASKYIEGIVRFASEGEPPSGEWVHVTPQMIEKTVPLIYNRIGNPRDAYQVIEKFSSRVDFWGTLPLQEYGNRPHKTQPPSNNKDSRKVEL